MEYKYEPGQRVILISEDPEEMIGTVEKIALSHEWKGVKWHSYYVRYDNGNLGCVDDFKLVAVNKIVED